MKRRSRIFFYAAASLLTGYLLSYAILARGGGYVWVRSGDFRPINHLAMSDMLVWQPRVGTFYAFRKVGGERTYESDFLGRLYSPLILLHQRFVAPSVRTIEPDGSVALPKPFFPARHQLHPSVQREIPEMERTFKLTWEQFADKFTATP